MEKQTGSVRTETIAVSGTMEISVQNQRHSQLLRRSRMEKFQRQQKVLEDEVRRLPCKEHRKGACTNPSCEKWHSRECICYKTKRDANLGNSVLMHTAGLMNSPTKGPKKKGDRTAVALLKDTRELGCVSQDLEPPKSSSILRKSTNILKPMRCVQFTKAVLRHANIRDQKPSLGNICAGCRHQRSSNAPKFEDRSQEETAWQERWAREAAWRLAKHILKLEEKHKSTFLSPTEDRCLPAPT